MRIKLILAIIVLFAGAISVFAVEADDSIDEVIKRTYNTGIAENSSLPKLPGTSPKSIKSMNFIDKPNVDKPAPSVHNLPPSVDTPASAVIVAPKVPNKVNIRTAKINRGKKIKVKLNTAVSDRSAIGSRVSFVSLSPVVTKTITLPAGSIFYGTVVNSHPPQMLGNGGLLSIKAEYVTYNGKTSYCEGNIVAVNHKMVLFNNIKGNNGYFKGIAKVTKPARSFYGRSVRVTKKFWNGPGFILTPFTYLPGAIFLVCDSIASPFIALFHKGDRVYLSKGTGAIIKLTAPTYVEY